MDFTLNPEQELIRAGAREFDQAALLAAQTALPLYTGADVERVLEQFRAVIRMTGVLDWEWAHLGDPLEDIGNICVREFWNPSGGLDGLFEGGRAR